MSADNFTLTQEYLQSVYTYRDGHLYRKNGKRLGSVCGRGYIHTSIKGKGYLLHRLIFLYHHGYIPEEIDHIDRVRDNNKIENLRASNRLHNQQNLGDYSTNTTGAKNVFYERGKYRVKMNINGKTRYFGFYKTLESAKIAAEYFRKQLCKI
jgi:hypothetical protein